MNKKPFIAVVTKLFFKEKKEQQSTSQTQIKNNKANDLLGTY